MLAVSIPHYRLGSPRFTARGTAVLRSSVYTRTSTNDDLMSSILSDGDYDQMFPLPPGIASNRTTVDLGHPAARSAVKDSSSVPFPNPDGPIEPGMYDALTFPPKSEDPSVVRYAPSGGIIAATPPRLIAQISSPDFLDYDLLSDFFLTFRSFLSPKDLVAYLMARLQWAIDRQDDIGKIVKVRTFVAMRHWILNYFVDDFVPDQGLRVTFCDSLRLLCLGLRKRSDKGARDFPLIGELKKCWRRTCELYWDCASVDEEIAAYEDLQPGGQVGPRDEPSDDTKGNLQYLDGLVFTQPDLSEQSIEGIFDKPASSTDAVGRRPIELAQDMKHARQLGSGTEGDISKRTVSAASDGSVHVLSCSIPARMFRQPDPSAIGAVCAHPVEIFSAKSSTPTQLRAMPISSLGPRPVHPHKRSGSFTDALRDQRSPVPLSSQPLQVSQVQLVAPRAGSLIRGNLLPPTQALTQPVPTSFVNDSKRLKYRQLNGTEVRPTADHKPAMGSGPGMKKLLGSVRRAISSKNGGGMVGNNNEPTEIVLTAPESRTAVLKAHLSDERLGAHAATPNSDPVRVDLLHQRIYEDWQRTKQEGSEPTKQDSGDTSQGATPPRDDDEMVSPRDSAKIDGRFVPSKIASTLTMGSKSIVIIDDTRPPPLPVISGDVPFRRPGSGQVTGRPSFIADGVTSASRSSRQAGVEASNEASTEESKGNRPSFVRNQSSQWQRRSDQTNDRYFEIASPSASSVQQQIRTNRSTYAGSLQKHPSLPSALRRRGTEKSFDATTRDGSEVDGAQDYFSRPPARMLRRRPGGDLRAAQNIADLEPMTRPRSAGSLTTCPGSVRNSVLHPSVTDHPQSPELRRRFSLGAVAETREKDALSLMRTHSSQPNLRPSFEAEVAKLARLPDYEDDGGVESTLLKLEGRFERRDSDESPLDYSLRQSRVTVDGGTATGSLIIADDMPYSATSKGHPAPNSAYIIRQSQEVASRLKSSGPAGVTRHQNSLVRPSITSQTSYSSIPVLERGLSHRPTKGAVRSRSASTPSSHDTLRLSRVSKPVPDSTKAVEGAPSTSNTPHSPANFEMPSSSDLPDTRDSHASFLLDSEGPPDSFLLDEDEDLSDLSSELSIDATTRTEPSRPNSKSVPPTRQGPTAPAAGLSSHPFRHPPSPPVTLEQATSTSETSHFFRNAPLTPDSSPIENVLYQHPNSHQQRPATAGQLPSRPEPVSSPVRSGKHLPYVLAHDCETLTQQFTLIEKDALSEIDWKDLVDLRWNHGMGGVWNWVEFLRSEKRSGVDLVIARFNVMVKWALSEIVMTEDVEERARTISKYIQLAACARTYRNYSTMYQFAVAVTSTDCTRLTETWELVPAAEVRVVSELEKLIQPVRNFHNLRVEMETATIDEGCIPFIGIYTHDLIFNSHRPADVPGAGSNKALVNFERHRTTAGVVKNLLRLLEASSRYQFRPVPGLLDRCLWMTALADSEIRSLSKKLQ
ncbi:MAG: Guanine nucleotide exchange factor lte1 [Caeruleum heppii]|nr:MAG: Guanine nucleotide exchange factor lte1 [Caeruleum heppii]